MPFVWSDESDQIAINRGNREAAEMLGISVQSVRNRRHRLIGLGLIESRRPRKNKLTPELLALVEARAAEGASRAQLRQEFDLSDRALKNVKTHAKRFVPQEDRAELVRKMVGEGMRDAAIGKALGLSEYSIYDCRRKNGIKLPAPERKRKDRPVTRPMRAIKARPTHAEWKPRRSTTDIECAVDKLRCVYPIVCAERTISRPHHVPEPYTFDTKFRVGNRRNVTADQLVGLANG